ncbi:conserved hypothetical protein [Phenylobacterium zucineum HLK1]|uniref:Methyltransferase small domain-containing protein n=1 Tax=Phenylobacterium zucineum (strain HLK1) TaxID=450851 RepID=B4RGP5_PHEZH|nr:class I SAM-dependent methyltransferase [Phenylobacterium zucineum]ACG77261.1 conserved hypothetical protein [Phenylobacterium zucineum HLK1]
MPSVTEAYFEVIKRKFDALDGVPTNGQMNDLLRLFSRWRSQLLANTYVAHHGAMVMHGPFSGMEYVAAATEGALMPRLLGTYEAELHPHLERFREAGVDCVIDVGCAEGYYAVGLARLLPQATVYAYDIDAAARRACADLAARNGVGERVIVGEEFKPEDFELFAGRNALVIMDAEGAEVDLLRPDLSPALRGMSLIVETHDVYRKGALEAVRGRFDATHDIQRVDLGLRDVPLPPWLSELPHLDHVLSIWEFRLAPTPWLVMRPKAA